MATMETAPPAHSRCDSQDDSVRITIDVAGRPDNSNADGVFEENEWSASGRGGINRDKLTPSTDTEHFTDESSREEERRKTTSTCSCTHSDEGEALAPPQAVSTSLSESSIRPCALPHSYESMIESALHNAGRLSFGVVAMEVWALDPSTQRLHRIPGGYWRCSSFPASAAVLKLEDETRRDYSPALPLLPGVGFVGSLWASSSYTDANVSWRDLRIMIADPDQPRVPRTDLLAEAFGLAAGMAFKVGDHRGLVVYYARYTVDKHAISTPSNLRFLRSATDMIGAVSAFRAPREVAVQERRERVQKIFKRVKSKIMAIRMFGGSIRSGTGGNEGSSKRSSMSVRQSAFRFGRFTSFGTGDEQRSTFRCRRRSSEADDEAEGPSFERCGKSLRQCGSSLRTKLALRTLAWRTKVKGGDHLPPPGMPTQESLFSLLVICLFMLMISGVNEGVRHATGDRHGILLASFGGLAVNLFCLPASQCSQPRNCFFGLSIAILSTIALVQIFPEDVLPIWVRIAVAPAVSIWLMTWLGYIHPPAGAVAVLFALGVDDPFITLGLLLFGWTLSVALATIMNNLSEKRAYPNYWQWRWVPEPLERVFASCRKGDGASDKDELEISRHTAYLGKRWWHEGG